MKRRVLSILLTLCITLALFPVPAFAANEEDDTLIELSPPPERSNITQPPLVFNAGDTPPTAATTISWTPPRRPSMTPSTTVR